MKAHKQQHVIMNFIVNTLDSCEENEAVTYLSVVAGLSEENARTLVENAIQNSALILKLSLNGDDGQDLWQWISQYLTLR